MITRSQALKAAQVVVATNFDPEQTGALVVFDDETIERERGRVYTYANSIYGNFHADSISRFPHARAYHEDNLGQ